MFIWRNYLVDDVTVIVMMAWQEVGRHGGNGKGLDMVVRMRKRTKVMTMTMMMVAI